MTKSALIETIQRKIVIREDHNTLLFGSGTAVNFLALPYLCDEGSSKISRLTILRFLRAPQKYFA